MTLDSASPFFVILVIIFSFLAIRLSQKNYYTMVLIYLPGVIVHELMHYLVALILANPTKFSIWPRRQGGKIVLGHVEVSGLHWLSAIPVAMAPLLMIPFSFFILSHALSLTTSIEQALWLFLFVNVLNSSLPSMQDYKMALSFPLGVTFYLALMLIAIREAFI